MDTKNGGGWLGPFNTCISFLSLLFFFFYDQVLTEMGGKDSNFFLRFHTLGDMKGGHVAATFSLCENVASTEKGEGLAQWWERLHPTNVAGVRFRPSASDMWSATDM